MPLYIEHMFYILLDMEVEGRVKRVLHTAWSRHGQGSVFTWPMVSRRARFRLPTGLPALDLATGGLPWGELVHLRGQASSGTHVLARSAALIAKRCGWRVLCLQDIRCAAVHPAPALHLPTHQALATALEIASQPSTLLIIEGPIAHSPSLRVLVPPLAKSGSVAMVLTERDTPLPFARTTVYLERSAWIRRRGDIVGCMAVTLWKEGHGPTFRVTAELLFDEDEGPLPIYAATS